MDISLVDPVHADLQLVIANLVENLIEATWKPLDKLFDFQHATHDPGGLDTVHQAAQDKIASLFSDDGVRIKVGSEDVHHSIQIHQCLRDHCELRSQTEPRISGDPLDAQHDLARVDAIQRGISMFGDEIGNA